MRWVGGTTGSVIVNLHQLREITKDSEPDVLQSTGSQRVGHD